MIEIIYFGIAAFVIIFSMGMAVVTVVWVAIGLDSLYDHIERRNRNRKSREYTEMIRGMEKKVKLNSKISR